jgi:sn1-specific diacylglycerol lipase
VTLDSERDLQFMKTLKRQMHFAFGAYGKLCVDFMGGGKLPLPALNRFTGEPLPADPERDAFCKYAEIDPEDFLYSSSVDVGDGSKHQPTFFIFVDHVQKDVVIALRGTLSVHDLMVDLVCEAVEIEYNGTSYQVHEGMYKAAKHLASSSKVLSTLYRSLLKYADYGLAITGHSLGAGK